VLQEFMVMAQQGEDNESQSGEFDDAQILVPGPAVGSCVQVDVIQGQYFPGSNVSQQQSRPGYIAVGSRVVFMLEAHRTKLNFVFIRAKCPIQQVCKIGISPNGESLSVFIQPQSAFAGPQLCASLLCPQASDCAAAIVEQQRASSSMEVVAQVVEMEVGQSNGQSNLLGVNLQQQVQDAKQKGELMLNGTKQWMAESSTSVRAYWKTASGKAKAKAKDLNLGVQVQAARQRAVSGAMSGGSTASSFLSGFSRRASGSGASGGSSGGSSSSGGGGGGSSSRGSSGDSGGNSSSSSSSSGAGSSGGGSSDGAGVGAGNVRPELDVSSVENTIMAIQLMESEVLIVLMPH
jgi:hypothetical protein